MARQSTKPPLETLQAELADPDYKVRKEGIKRLMRYQRARAYEPLLTLLGDARSDVRVKAVEALGQLKDQRALEPLLALLIEKQVSVRAQAAKALGHLNDRRAVPDLLKLLKGPRQVSRAAARSLGQLRDPLALPALLAYLPEAGAEDLYGLVDAVSAFDLPTVVEPLLALCLLYDDRDIQELIAIALSKLSASSLPVLMGILSDQRRPADIRQCVALSCCQQPRAGSTQTLIKALDDSDVRVRRLAARALCRLQDPDAIKPLVNHLSDEDVLLGQTVIGALRYLEASNETEALLGCLSSPHEKVVAEAARALEHFHATGAVPTLLNLLCQECTVHNWPLAEALCHLGSPELVDELLQRLPVIPPRLRRPVLHILEYFPDRRAVDTLLSLLDFEMQDGYDLHFQRRIARLLKKIGDPRALEPLREKMVALENMTRDHLQDVLYEEIRQRTSELAENAPPV